MGYDCGPWPWVHVAEPGTVCSGKMGCTRTKCCAGVTTTTSTTPSPTTAPETCDTYDCGPAPWVKVAPPGTVCSGPRGCTRTKCCAGVITTLRPTTTVVTCASFTCTKQGGW